MTDRKSTKRKTNFFRLRQAVISAAEIHQRLDAVVGGQGVCRENFSQENLMVAAGVYLDNFTFHVSQSIAQQRLSFGTIEVDLLRANAVFFGKHTRMLFLVLR